MGWWRRRNERLDAKLVALAKLNAELEQVADRREAEAMTEAWAKLEEEVLGGPEAVEGFHAMLEADVEKTRRENEARAQALCGVSHAELMGRFDEAEKQGLRGEEFFASVFAETFAQPPVERSASLESIGEEPTSCVVEIYAQQGNGEDVTGDVWIHEFDWASVDELNVQIEQFVRQQLSDDEWHGAEVTWRLLEKKWSDGRVEGRSAAGCDPR
jgi:hypothetical protein